MLLYLVLIFNDFTNSQSYFLLALEMFSKFKINQTKFNIDQVLDDWL